MRLLNTSTLELATFPHKTPPYAILSHTWGENEAPFEVFAARPKLMVRSAARFRRRRQYPKVAKACALAKSQGYEWIWIDTCCIEKNSSAELSEAINSMYSWYARATVCYAYLADLATPAPVSNEGEGEDPGRGSAEEQDRAARDLAAALSKSRWFTRGWTLQELVAPPVVEFYSADWTPVGTKASLAPALEAVTLIPAGLFSPVWQTLVAGGLAQQSLHLLSVAQRLSWAARRTTTRPEDIAYCLMGLFDVHMPLLYGEGEAKAFARLQTEIARTTNDQSLFAWGSWHNSNGDGDGDGNGNGHNDNGSSDGSDNGHQNNRHHPSRRCTTDRVLCYSLLAPHPRCFAAVSDLKAASRHSSVNELDWPPPFETTNDGYLRIRMRVCRNTEAERQGMMDDDHVAFLECELRGEPGTVVGLFVRRLSDVGGAKRYVRVHHLLGQFPRSLVARCELEDVLLGALPRHIPRFDFIGQKRIL